MSDTKPDALVEQRHRDLALNIVSHGWPTRSQDLANFERDCIQAFVDGFCAEVKAGKADSMLDQMLQHAQRSEREHTADLERQLLDARRALVLCDWCLPRNLAQLGEKEP